MGCSRKSNSRLDELDGDVPDRCEIERRRFALANRRDGDHDASRPVEPAVTLFEDRCRRARAPCDRSHGHLLRVAFELRAPSPVLAGSGELVSALVNLMVNAIDAAGTVGKTLTLRSGEDEGGSFVEVEDDGPGMPAEVEARVFEPFFTTKGDEGTGSAWPWCTRRCRDMAAS